MSYKNLIKQKEFQAKHYQDNKEAYRERNKNRKQRVREQYNAFKDSLSCMKCGESHNACLSFHHKDQSIKIDTISRTLSTKMSIEAVMKEVSKYDVLCYNCHAKLHWIEKHSESKGKNEEPSVQSSTVRVELSEEDWSWRSVSITA